MVAHHPFRQFAIGIGRLEPVTEPLQGRQTQFLVAVMPRPAGRVGQGLAQIVGQCREPHGRIGRQARRLIQHHQRMQAGIDFGVVLGRLRHAEQRLDLGE